jgi:hypothetical protein
MTIDLFRDGTTTAQTSLIELSQLAVFVTLSTRNEFLFALRIGTGFNFFSHFLDRQFIIQKAGLIF